MKHLITPILTLMLLFLQLIACKNDNSDATSNENDKAQTSLPSKQSDFGEARFKWGFMNSNGIITIAPQFDDTRNFAGSLAAVQLKGNWGFINKQGNMMIEHNTKGFGILKRD